MDAEKKLLNELGLDYQIRSLPVSESSVVRAIICGSGPSIVLVHGLDIGWGQWYSVMPALAKSYTVIALDLPGAGSGQRRNSTQASDPQETVKALGIALKSWASNGAVVVGHSIGAFAALKIAAHGHASINTVVAVDPLGFTDYLTPKFRPLSLGVFARLFSKFIYPPNRKSLKNFLEDVMVVKGAMSESFLDYVIENVNRPPISHPAMRIHGLLRHFRIRKEYVLTNPEMQNISCPVIVIHGEQDPLIPLGKIQPALSVLRYLSLMVMKNTGHVPPIERPERFTGMILEALRG